MQQKARKEGVDHMSVEDIYVGIQKTRKKKNIITPAEFFSRYYLKSDIS